jgi:hypothetical protein
VVVCCCGSRLFCIVWGVFDGGSHGRFVECLVCDEFFVRWCRMGSSVVSSGSSGCVGGVCCGGGCSGVRSPLSVAVCPRLVSGGLSVVERWVLSRCVGGVSWVASAACPVAGVGLGAVLLPAGVFGGLVERGLVVWDGDGVGVSGLFTVRYRVSDVGLGVLGGSFSGVESVACSCVAGGGFDVGFWDLAFRGDVLPGLRLSVEDVRVVLSVVRGDVKCASFGLVGFGLGGALEWGVFSEPGVLVGNSGEPVVSLGGSVRVFRSGCGVSLRVDLGLGGVFVLGGDSLWVVDVVHAGVGGCDVVGWDLLGCVGG